ncbi:MAG: SpoIIE family protein phosphatase [Actinobacteria bacterium]|nr:SpoIIE family protein phosphatase [Actinomycetota bacterium]
MSRKVSGQRPDEPASTPAAESSKSGQSEQKPEFLYVGIGASAGGVEAFRQFLGLLSPTANLAYFLVLHMGDVKSLLAEILARETPLSVIEVTNDMDIQPNTVYVMPSGSDMTIRGNMLRLNKRATGPARHAPIDTFFRSLADDQGSRAVGVVLTGADSDGAQGLAAIKANGGLTFAQDPDTAAYPSMPRHAVDVRAADFVLPIPQIVQEVERLGKGEALGRPLTEEQERRPEDEQSMYNAILELLRKRTGVDFQRYKESTIKRRIQRRMVILRMTALEDYVSLLESSPEQVDVLYQDILIMVTQFFRDPEAFDFIKSEVFPNILQRKKDHEAWRLWVVGCSAGQEAYSLGITLLEFFGAGSRPHVQIFATDVNEHDIPRARTGIYPSSIAAETGEARLKKFFDQVPEGYQVKKALREMCIFAKHDVTRDPPFTRLDMILCRNVLIYFGAQMQSRLIPLFHYALHPSGFLVLGSSESVGRYTGLFELIEKKNKIYARKPGRGEPPFEFGQPLSLVSAEPRVIGGPRPERPDISFDIQREADRIEAGVYAPASIVVNEDLHILHFRGDTSPFLAHPPGVASFDLIKMAKEGLEPALRQAIGEAKRENRNIRLPDVHLRTRGGDLRIDLNVIPFHSPGGDTYFLVSFREAQGPGTEETAQAGEGQDDYKLLREELVMTRDHLETVIRDKEAALEELRAAYEEIQSSNEELQSINEELETAKEELQSINEELITVNEELQVRNQELTRAHDDLRNLLANIDIPVIMLDQDMRIRSYTPGTERLLHVIPGDIGRPLSDFRMHIHIPELEQMILRSIHDVSPQEKEVRDESGAWYSVHVRPYKTGDMRIGGAVVSFVDVTDLKRGAELSKESAQLSDILGEVSMTLSSETDPKRIVARLVKRTADALKAPLGLLITAHGNHWVVENVHQLPADVVGASIPFDDLAAAVQANRAGHAVLAPKGSVAPASFLGKLGIASLLAVPLSLRDREPGVLLLGYRNGEHEFTDATAEFTDKLALTLTLALENARFRKAESDVADIMREELAPSVVPVPGLEVGYAYRTAAELEQVGGDFLDVFPLDDKSAIVLVGDVAGHGVRASTASSQVRSGVHILAQDEHDPARLLARMNSALAGVLEPDVIVSVCLTLIDLSNFTLTIANAGHCEPAMEAGDQVKGLQTAHGAPLGALKASEYSASKFTARPGDRFVVYTDGITGARSGGSEYGEGRLYKSIRESAMEPVETAADNIMKSVVAFAGDKLNDDAIIAVIDLTGILDRSLGAER